MKPKGPTPQARLAAALALAVAFAAVAFPAAATKPVTEGTLQILDSDGEPAGVCPLEHTDVQVDISGYIARVTLTQRFRNPLAEPIEAVYTFPMSERAAVDSMTMLIGDRTIKGIIKEREEARKAYEAARAAGQAASLLDQERPNIFTQSVANILPNDKVEIRISYVEYLEYEDGEYTLAFPMVVGPRYIPGNPGGAGGTDQVPDAARITPPVTPEGTRAGHDISVAVSVDAGVAIREIDSVLHEVEIERPAEHKAVVRLKEKAELPNRDFILRYAVAGDAIEDAVMSHADARGGFFTVILQPPDRVAPEAVTPKEMIFVIDCSGSMRGFPIEKAKATMRRCIEGMNPDDTFNLVSFAGGTGYCFDRPVPNTKKNRTKALEYLDALEGSGGTEMMAAIRAALEKQEDPERLRIVCFMTDGFIGNDMGILDAIQKNVDSARVFAFGIGNGVNRFLIEGMGRTGRGASEVVTLQSDADEAVKRFHERIQSPLLTDISIDFGNLPVEEVFPDPGAVPDLFAARPLVLKGRYTGPASGVISVRGQTAQGPFERRISVDLPKEEPAHDVLAPLWARERIAFLMDRDWLNMQQGKPDPDIQKAITDLGLEYSLVTQYTSFVAVEERRITEGGEPKTIQVPVEMTDGVSYEGVFGEAGASGPIALGAPFLLQRHSAPQAQTVAPPPPQAGVAGNVPAPVAVGRVESETLAEEAPGRMPAADEAGPRPSSKSEEAPAAAEPSGEQAHPKIDPALHNLASRLVNGDLDDGKVRVRDGWVEVFIRLSDDSRERIQELRKLGVKITSHARSNKLVLGRVRVEDLERVADLAFVTKVEPAKF